MRRIHTRIYKFILCLLALLTALGQCAGTVGTAFAYEEEIPTYAREDFSGMDIDDVMDELLLVFNTPKEKVYAGYMNLVTGEEHYWQGDEWVMAASMYKVPLNMLFAENMATGQFVWEERIKDVDYTEVLEQTILYSSNHWAMFLWDFTNGYRGFRELIAPYMGIDLSEVGPTYYDDNTFTPRQMICCLKTLYEGGQERFPRILETMQQAEPERFFRMKEQRFNIAQKYGYVTEWASSYMNCCGVCMTDEPIAIVMFTRNAPFPEELLTAFCTAMCDFTQYTTALRAEQARDKLYGQIKERRLEAPLSPVARVSDEEAHNEQEDNKTEVRSMATVICCVAVLAAAIITIIYIIMKKKEHELKIFWMLMAVLVLAAALILCAVGLKAGTVYAKPEGDPAQTVDEFFTAITDGDYDRAYSYLRDYTSLGLENTPQTEAGQAAYEALKGSYRYALLGECERDKLEAVQKVSFSYLDLAKTHDDISALTMTELEKLVEDLPRDEIYDENNQYRSEVANEAYMRAVKAVMKKADSYSATVTLDVKVEYSDGQWLIVADPTLLKSLNGGTAY